MLKGGMRYRDDDLALHLHFSLEHFNLFLSGLARGHFKKSSSAVLSQEIMRKGNCLHALETFLHGIQ